MEVVGGVGAEGGGSQFRPAVPRFWLFPPSTCFQFTPAGCVGCGRARIEYRNGKSDQVCRQFPIVAYVP